jgi:predicted component of type VI protein secretion system
MRRAANHYGLLQRIDGRPVADEVQDVVEHLGHLLNVKRDYGSFVDGMGLSISDTMWSARPMVSLAGHIREQIERFEPRLRDVRIEPDAIDDHMCPSFRIYGTIGTASVRLSLSLHTVYCSVHVTQE